MAGRRPAVAKLNLGSKPKTKPKGRKTVFRGKAGGTGTPELDLGQTEPIANPDTVKLAPADVVSVEEQLRSAVLERLGTSRFDLWFGEGVKLGVVAGDDGGSQALEVGVPNAFFREWIQGHFAANLIEAAEAVTGKTLSLKFQIDSEGQGPDGVAGLAVDEHRPSGLERESDKTSKPQTSARSRTKETSGGASPAGAIAGAAVHSTRNPRRLDEFVTGPCNRMAHAACIEMAATLGTSFNPLVVHGGVGLGKTHLLEGLGHAIRAKRPGVRLIHVTAEAFTNGFLEAMRTSSLASFRSRFRGAEALIVDDIHFLAAKRATQDEFLHTFNALMSEGLPIIVASDQHPRSVSKLTEELATRFLGGMVVKVESPDPVTRRAILKTKALARGVDVPDAVIAYIAEHLRASVRELEGALHSLIAQAVLSGKKLDLNLAKSALRDTIRHTSQAIALKDVERAICNLFQIDADVLKSESRARVHAFPRMIAMYLARKHTGAAYNEIGRFFGGRNHSTVISAEKKVGSWLEREKETPPLAGFETVAEVLAAIDRVLGT